MDLLRASATLTPERLGELPRARLDDKDAEAVYAIWTRCYASLARSRAGDGAMPAPADVYRQRVRPAYGPAGRLVSLVIPAWCETRRIERSVRLVRRFLAEFPLNIEVIYVVEASPDDTLARARRAAADHPRIRVHDNKVQHGKGYAVRCGVRLAGGEVIVYNDVDFSVPLHQLLYTLAALEQHPGVQILIGERVRLTLGSMSRRLLSHAFQRAAGRLAGLPRHWDTQCGFKAFRREAAVRVFARQSLSGFAFDVEVLALGRALGLRTASQRVPWLNDERSTVRPLSGLARVAAELAWLRLVLGGRGRGAWAADATQGGA